MRKVHWRYCPTFGSKEATCYCIIYDCQAVIEMTAQKRLMERQREIEGKGRK